MSTKGKVKGIISNLVTVEVDGPVAQNEIAYIELFMVDSRLAGQGLGSKIIAELLSQLATHFKRMRIGYVESNPQSSHFWSKVGFCPTGEVKELAGKTLF